MRHVPVADAKEQFAELIEAARGGEDVLITKSGEPVARISGVASGHDRERARAAFDRIASRRRQRLATGATATADEICSFIHEGRKY